MNLRRRVPEFQSSNCGARRRFALRLAAVTALFFVAAMIVISCSTVSRDVSIPLENSGANFIGNKACFYCHTNYSHTFAASPHARVRFNTPQRIADVGCESCHGPGSKHAEIGGGRGKFIINPGKDPAACFQCHFETHAEFQMPQRHPVIEGKMNCVQCHDPHGFDIMKPSGTGILPGNSGTAMARVNENCAQCHREQTRPMIFEHEALRDGCATCHNPHGSINRKLLTQNDPNLCLRCHTQVQSDSGTILIGAIDHTAFLSRATCWAAGCHTAVHGSNVDPWLRY